MTGLDAATACLRDAERARRAAGRARQPRASAKSAATTNESAGRPRGPDIATPDARERPKRGRRAREHAHAREGIREGHTHERSPRAPTERLPPSRPRNDLEGPTLPSRLSGLLHHRRTRGATSEPAVRRYAAPSRR